MASNWEIKQFRLTIFPHKSYKAPSKALWPASSKFVLEKQTSQSKTGETILEGKHQKNRVVLSITPIRISLSLSPEQEIAFNPPSVVTLGKFDDNLTLIHQIATEWSQAKAFPETKRVAFGAVPLKPVKNTVEGYKLLNKYLPFKLDGKKTSDFLHQINIPTKSKIIKNLAINRLSKWSVLRLTTKMSTIQETSSEYKYPDIFLVSLELDVNTAKEFSGKFEKKQTTALFGELLDLGKELCEKGIRAK